MTVRDAIQDILASLTGVQNICACHDGGKNPLAAAALTALNRSMQEIWLSPSMRHQCLEPLTVSFATTAPVDLPAAVQTAVGPVTWNSYRPIPLAGTATEFRNYFNQFQDEHWDAQLWDDLVFAAQHNVTGGFPWYAVEFYLPLWDDRSILVWFDNAAHITPMDLTAATSPGGFALNSRTISVRVELPSVNTFDTAGRALVLAALRRYAGSFLTVEDNAVGGLIRCYRRRMADTADWQIHTVSGVALSRVKGPRVPAIAWAEELKTTTAGVEDLARVRLHLSPPTAGTVSLNVIKEPPAYELTDLDCDGDGLSATEITIAHQYAASLLLPLARLAFVQGNPTYCTPAATASTPALEAAAAAARTAHGMSSPNAPQNMQRNQTTSHAHA